MLYELKRIIKRLINKEKIYFITGDELEKFIKDGKAFCHNCDNEITETNDVYKIVVKKKTIIFLCKSCIEDGK